MSNPTPEQQRWFTNLEFLGRFTAEERRAIWNAAKQDDAVADILMLGLAAQGVMNDGPQALALTADLVLRGLLTEERRTQILYA